MNLSVIIITRNEERDLPACLESVRALSDDIVIVDSGSTDNTLDVAKKVTSKIFHHEWAGYSAQKQFALEKAQGPWVLNLDADERLSPTLQQEIKDFLSREHPEEPFGYRLRFRHYFMEKPLFFGAGSQETHVRLFHKDHARYGKSLVHEGIQIEGSLGKLNGSVNHYSYSSISEYLRKCNEYTSLIAEQKFKSGKRFHWWHHLRLPYEFFVRAILKLGLLDGGVGLIYAVLSSYYVWLKFVKLKDLERGEKS